jgi:hypothetical protein
MSKVNFREEVLNVVLAELLEQRGMLSVPETIRKSIVKKTRNLPDILVGDLLGIRIVIEGRFDSSKQARDSLLKDARGRVEDGISPVCLAVLYPSELRSAESVPKLRHNIAEATLGIRVISESGDGNWAAGNVDDIADALRRSYELLVTEDVVTQSVGEIEDAIEAASDVFVHSGTLTERLRKGLGIPAETDAEDGEED